MLDAEALADLVAELVADEIEKATAPLVQRIAELEARPAPELLKGDPGESVDPAIVQEMIVSEIGKAVDALPKPKDGEPGKDAANIVEALKDSGELVLTLQDGRLIRTGIRDGEKGADGTDGLGFDDLDVAVLDDDRTIELSFRRGEEEKAFTLKWPTPIDRGVWNEKTEYARGDAVTWGGSLWIAQKDTPVGKPDAPESGWRLSVKKGRDGKDAKNG